MLLEEYHVLGNALGAPVRAANVRFTFGRHGLDGGVSQHPHGPDDGSCRRRDGAKVHRDGEDVELAVDCMRVEHSALGEWNALRDGLRTRVASIGKLSCDAELASARHILVCHPCHLRSLQHDGVSYEYYSLKRRTHAQARKVGCRVFGLVGDLGEALEGSSRHLMVDNGIRGHCLPVHHVIPVARYPFCATILLDEGRLQRAFIQHTSTNIRVDLYVVGLSIIRRCRERIVSKWKRLLGGIRRLVTG